MIELYSTKSLSYAAGSSGLWMKNVSEYKAMAAEFVTARIPQWKVIPYR